VRYSFAGESTQSRAPMRVERGQRDFLRCVGRFASTRREVKNRLATVWSRVRAGWVAPYVPALLSCRSSAVPCCPAAQPTFRHRAKPQGRSAVGSEARRRKSQNETRVRRDSTSALRESGAGEFRVAIRGEAHHSSVVSCVIDCRTSRRHLPQASSFPHLCGKSATSSTRPAAPTIDEALILEAISEKLRVASGAPQHKCLAQITLEPLCALCFTASQQPAPPT